MNDLLLNSDIDSEFLRLISKENQVFKAEVMKGGYTVVSSFDGWITFWY